MPFFEASGSLSATATHTPSGPVPSGSSVAHALEKIGYDLGVVHQNYNVEAAWSGADKMTVKLTNKWIQGDVLVKEVSVSKSEAKAAKSSGKSVSASSLSATTSSAPVSSPAPSSSPAKTSNAGSTVTVGKVPASDVHQLLKDLGMTKGQLAKAVGKSPSLISEWTGGGHGNLMNASQWSTTKAAALAWVQSH